MARLAPLHGFEPRLTFLTKAVLITPERNMAQPPGLEPGHDELTARCSTIILGLNNLALKPGLEPGKYCYRVVNSHLPYH
jgi:hypothetical protein